MNVIITEKNLAMLSFRNNNIFSKETLRLEHFNTYNATYRTFFQISLINETNKNIIFSDIDLQWKNWLKYKVI